MVNARRGAVRELRPGVRDLDGARRALEADGYLLVRGLLEREAVRRGATAVTNALREFGWLEAAPDSSGRPVAALGRRPLDLHAELALFERCLAAEALHLVGRDRALLALVRGLLGDTAVLVHPNPALRVVMPGGDPERDVTPPHQDLVGMQGSTRTVTAWCPLLDVPIDAGPIEIAAASHRGGARPTIAVPGARVLCCATEGYEDEWLVSHLSPGDVVLFSSLTVHRARANRSTRPRLSVDFRYQPVGEPICAFSLRSPLGERFDEVRATWQDSGLREILDPARTPVVPFDPTFPTRLTQSASSPPPARPR